MILNSGYLGFAELSTGNDPEGWRWNQAIAAFTRQLDDAEPTEDAEFGIAQLQKVHRRHLA